MNWETVKLGSVCDVRDGTHDSPKFIENGFPLITSKNLVNGRIDKANVSYISENDYKNIAKRSKVDFGDILMPMIGTIGNPVIVEDLNPEFAIKNVALIKFTNKSPDRFFIKLILQSPLFLTYITKISRGGTQKFLSLGDIRKFAFPLPPIANQIRIATLLSRVEALIATRKDNLRLLDEFLKSMFLEMFGDPGRNEKGWAKLKGDELCSLITVGVVIKPASYYVDAGTPALRSQNVRENRIDLDSGLVFFSHADSNGPLKKSMLKTNDVVIVRTGKPGTAAVVPASLDGANCIDLILCRPNKELINPYYLVFFYNSPGGKYIVGAAQRGQIQQHFNVHSAKDSLIPLPPLDLQNQFAAIVEKTESLKNHYQQTLIELENLYGALSQKAFKGELDLSRVPLPEIAIHHKDHEESNEKNLRDLSGLRGEPSQIPILPTNLLQLFEDFISKQTGTFSLASFWQIAEQALRESTDEDLKLWSVADYDQVKQHLFELVENGKITQSFNTNSNQIELISTGGVQCCPDTYEQNV